MLYKSPVYNYKVASNPPLLMLLVLVRHILFALGNYSNLAAFRITALTTPEVLGRCYERVYYGGMGLLFLTKVVLIKVAIKLYTVVYKHTSTPLYSYIGLD